MDSPRAEAGLLETGRLVSFALAGALGVSEPAAVGSNGWTGATARPEGELGAASSADVAAGATPSGAGGCGADRPRGRSSGA